VLSSIRSHYHHHLFFSLLSQNAPPPKCFGLLPWRRLFLLSLSHLKKGRCSHGEIPLLGCRFYMVTCYALPLRVLNLQSHSTVITVVPVPCGKNTACLRVHK
jgi:hypothetical protein